jgi:hypothetical protein
MNMQNDPISRDQSDAPTPASKQKPVRTPQEEQAATKPPLLWMVLPLILIGLAIYLAR